MNRLYFYGIDGRITNHNLRRKELYAEMLRALYFYAGVAEWQTQRTQNPSLIRVGSNPIAGTIFYLCP